MATEEEEQADDNDVNFKRASIKPVATGYDVDMPTTTAAVVNECFDLDFENKIDDQLPPSARRMENFTVNTLT